MEFPGMVHPYRRRNIRRRFVRRVKSVGTHEFHPCLDLLRDHPPGRSDLILCRRTGCLPRETVDPFEPVFQAGKSCRLRPVQ